MLELRERDPVPTLPHDVEPVLRTRHSDVQQVRFRGREPLRTRGLRVPPEGKNNDDGLLPLRGVPHTRSELTAVTAAESDPSGGMEGRRGYAQGRP